MGCNGDNHNFRMADHRHPNGNWADECLVYVCSKCGAMKEHYVNIN